MKRKRTNSKTQSGRRAFLRSIAIGTITTSLAPKRLFLNQEKQPDRVKKGDMYYRRLGRTDLNISEISLGSSPLPEKAILHQAIEKGVNYIDTSHTYMNGNAERQIGEFFKELGRDRIYVGTKFHLRRRWSEESIIKSVNSSLARLQTDYVDVLLIHGAENEKDLDDEQVLNAFEKLKKQGKYRFRGLSCHSNHHRVVKTAVDCGHYDMIQLGYNVFDIRPTEKDIETYNDYLGQSGISRLISLAKSKDVGIIAMKTLKVGGKRQNLNRYKTGTTSIYQAMLKWALENRNISSVVIEMLTFQELEEDMGVIGKKLTLAEKRNLLRFVAENSIDYCQMCGLCQKACPSRIRTTSILRYLTYHQSYSKTAFAREAYSSLKQFQTSASCQNCAECERVCPYGVSIRKKIKEAHLLLG